MRRTEMTFLCMAMAAWLAACGNNAPGPVATRESTLPLALSEFDDCDGAAWCPRMVVIPQGSFIMGAPDNEPGRGEDEGPLRRVEIRSFALGKFAVTRGQWSVFASETARADPVGECAYAASGANWRNVGFPQEDSHPVLCISWPDAQDYVRWLGERTGRKYRLASESEWEYAARAGSSTAYPWGETASHDHANYGTEKCCGPARLGRDQWDFSSPVGSFPANAFGLHDMHGNAFQWVQDCYQANYIGLPADGSAHDRPDCRHRVGRGGVFLDRPDLLRSANRNWAPPLTGPGSSAGIEGYRSIGFGLRVARDL